jgi:hypothetical protein
MPSIAPPIITQTTRELPPKEQTLTGLPVFGGWLQQVGSQHNHLAFHRGLRFTQSMCVRSHKNTWLNNNSVAIDPNTPSTAVIDNTETSDTAVTTNASVNFKIYHTPHPAAKHLALRISYRTSSPSDLGWLVSDNDPSVFDGTIGLGVQLESTGGTIVDPGFNTINSNNIIQPTWFELADVGQYGSRAAILAISNVEPIPSAGYHSVVTTNTRCLHIPLADSGAVNRRGTTLVVNFFAITGMMVENILIQDVFELTPT